MNFNRKKAEEKIPKRTTTGLDKVPIRLINELGPKPKDALLKALEKPQKTDEYQSVGDKVE